MTSGPSVERPRIPWLDRTRLRSGFVVMTDNEAVQKVCFEKKLETVTGIIDASKEKGYRWGPR
jgi:hypothetical protein